MRSRRFSSWFCRFSRAASSRPSPRLPTLSTASLTGLAMAAATFSTGPNTAAAAERTPSSGELSPPR